MGGHAGREATSFTLAISKKVLTEDLIIEHVFDTLVVIRKPASAPTGSPVWKG